MRRLRLTGFEGMALSLGILVVGSGCGGEATSPAGPDAPAPQSELQRATASLTDQIESANFVVHYRPGDGDRAEPPRLAAVVEAVQDASPDELAARLAEELDRLDATSRWALLKLFTGALRVGVSARLAKTALAELSGKPLSEIEEVWYGLEPPYEPLFAWLSGEGPRPDTGSRAVFRPLMLSHPSWAGRIDSGWLTFVTDRR